MSQRIRQEWEKRQQLESPWQKIASQIPGTKEWGEKERHPWYMGGRDGELRPYTWRSWPVIQFTGGIVKGAGNMVKGIVDMVTHPIQTGKNMWQAITHPKETLGKIGDDLNYSFEHGFPAALRKFFKTSSGVVDWEKAGEDVFTVGTGLFSLVKGPQLVRGIRYEAGCRYRHQVGRQFINTRTKVVISEEALPWPDGEGFVAGTEGVFRLRVGTVLTRYTTTPGRGSYFAPKGTPYVNRGIPKKYPYYEEYVVMKEFSVKYGQIAPVKEFGGAGGGWQYKLESDLLNLDQKLKQKLIDRGIIQWLMEEKYLERVKLKKIGD
ncbi:hypothetical protein BREVNS_1310 [Brevinematales bacterium NS]|nr:hypothetical protein BREVNS_1310 [Brevinematales bacterium NS]